AHDRRPARGLSSTVQSRRASCAGDATLRPGHTALGSGGLPWACSEQDRVPDGARRKTVEDGTKHATREVHGWGLLNGAAVVRVDLERARLHRGQLVGEADLHG